MSKIDASENDERFIVRESIGVWTLVWEVFDRNAEKVYGYFTTPEGARAYKEVLDNDRLIYCDKAEAVPEVPGMLQGDSGEGGDKS